MIGLKLLKEYPNKTKAEQIKSYPIKANLKSRAEQSKASQRLSNKSKPQKPSQASQLPIKWEMGKDCLCSAFEVFLLLDSFFAFKRLSKKEKTSRLPIKWEIGNDCFYWLCSAFEVFLLLDSF